MVCRRELQAAQARFRPPELPEHSSTPIFSVLLLLVLGLTEPAVMGGLCNGVGALSGQLMAAGVRPGKLVLLRFHGHGNRGLQAVSYGTGWHVLFDAIRHEPVRALHRRPRPGEFPDAEVASVRLESLHSQISFASLQNPETLDQFMLLRPLFHPLGSVEFHGCQVGGGADGQRMLRRVADLLGVPAVGARQKQTTGDAVRYHGPIEIQTPGGRGLVDWSNRLPPTISYG